VNEPQAGAPLSLQLEIAPGPGAAKTLFLLVPELELRVPLEEVKAPFRCTSLWERRSPGREQDQVVTVSCDPTQRAAARIDLIAFVNRPASRTPQGLLSINPRRCSGDACVKRELGVWRELTLAPLIAGQSPPPPCAPAAPPVPLDVQLVLEPRFATNLYGKKVRVRSPRLDIAALKLSVPAFQTPWADTTCATAFEGGRFALACNSGSFVAIVADGVLRFESDGGARGGIPLPCGAVPRWPRYQTMARDSASPEVDPKCLLALQRCEADCLAHLSATAEQGACNATPCAAAPGGCAIP
jgi:hypothetical protein